MNCCLRNGFLFSPTRGHHFGLPSQLRFLAVLLNIFGLTRRPCPFRPENYGLVFLPPTLFCMIVPYKYVKRRPTFSLWFSGPTSARRDRFFHPHGQRHVRDDLLGWGHTIPPLIRMLRLLKTHRMVNVFFSLRPKSTLQAPDAPPPFPPAYHL